jgi:cell wall-associated NlpC family hydrolase
MKNRVFKVLTLLLAIGLAYSFSIKAGATAKIMLNKTNVVLEMNTEERLELLNRVPQEEEDGLVTADDPNEIDTTIKWKSSNKKVVEVDEAGVLTPVSVGSAKITAKADGKKYTCKVVVIDYTGMSNEQKEVISYALQFVGNPYRYGGVSLTKGADCSGFTHAVYKKFGYDLFHNAYQQMVDTKKVKMKKIQPGDLIFYGYSKNSCSHVALYIGNGKVVHASTPATGIVISNYKYRKYCGVGRVLKKATYPETETTPGTIQNNDSVTQYAKSK